MLFRRWYVAALQVGREDLAEWHLRRQGFVTWLPRQLRTVQHARRRIERRVAFFPGYMFISLDLSRERWRPVNGTTGVRSLIMQGDRPLACPFGMVEDLQVLADPDGLLEADAGLSENAQVRILRGPFAEMVGTLVRLDGSGRARVLLAMMQGQVAVSLRKKDLVAAAG
jgi:transcription antitermination factor NusG